MSGAEDNVPDELDEQLDDLAEELRDPDRSDRTIEDQGEEGRIVDGDDADESSDENSASTDASFKEWAANFLKH